MEGQFVQPIQNTSMSRKICVHIHDPKWETFTKFQEEIVQPIFQEHNRRVNFDVRPRAEITRWYLLLFNHAFALCSCVENTFSSLPRLQAAAETLQRCNPGGRDDPAIYRHRNRETGILLASANAI